MLCGDAATVYVNVFRGGSKYGRDKEKFVASIDVDDISAMGKKASLVHGIIYSTVGFTEPIINVRGEFLYDFNGVVVAQSVNDDILNLIRF